MSSPIRIIDEITVVEEQAIELQSAYFEKYVPSAQARGMMLEGAWRSPPFGSAGRSMTLHFTWSVPDVAAWWGMRLGVTGADLNGNILTEPEEDRIAWWRFVDSIAVSRKRYMMCPLDRDVKHD